MPVLAALAFAGCGGGDAAPAEEAPGGGKAELVVYSGREEELVAPLFQMFEDETGIDVRVRYGESAELAATIAEEGENSPADVFFAQDPGSLGALEAERLLARLPTGILKRVDARFRDADGHWVGTSGRSRVIAYNTEALSEEDVPDSVWELTHPRWKGKIGLPPTNASFQAFVTAMRLTAGHERTRRWLEGIKANEPRFYEKNLPTVEAVASGEVELGLVNHYYVYLLKEEQPDAPVANHFLAGRDVGALVSVAGVAILRGADHSDTARRFVDFLLSERAQRFYAEAAEEAEYPLIEGVEPREGLPPLRSLRGPKVRLDEFGAELERTLELLNEVGFTS